LEFSKAGIEKFAICGDTNANAKINMEQAKNLCEKTFCWWQDQMQAAHNIIRAGDTESNITGSDLWIRRLHHQDVVRNNQSNTVGISSCILRPYAR
jgi:hypothetical protein